MSNLTGACVDITVNGKKYSLEPLRFEDMEWLEMKLKSRCLEMARLSCVGLPPKGAKEVMDHAFERAERIDIFRQIDSFFTPTGLALLLWRMVRRNHPDMTVDDTGEWVSNRDLMRELNPQLTLLMGSKKTQESPEAQMMT